MTGSLGQQRAEGKYGVAPVVLLLENFFKCLGVKNALRPAIQLFRCGVAQAFLHADIEDVVSETFGELTAQYGVAAFHASLGFTALATGYNSAKKRVHSCPSRRSKKYSYGGRQNIPPSYHLPAGVQVLLCVGVINKIVSGYLVQISGSERVVWNNVIFSFRSYEQWRATAHDFFSCLTAPRAVRSRMSPIILP